MPIASVPGPPSVGREVSMHGPFDVLDFWFDEARDDAELGRGSRAYARWFGGGPELDASITSMFGEDVELARAGKLDHWRLEPRSLLALVLLLDQLPRHVFRGRAEAFASDATALELTRTCIAARTDEALSLCERVFLYLPLQHSEQLEDHDVAIRCYDSLVEVASARGLPILGFCRAAVTNQHEHTDTLRRFGRYPYRNAALNRISTPDETAWLAAQAQ
jgi:uncharacterized protein (DUF924 family)